VSYAVKEIFYTLQGEGAQAGRAAVFCRFTGCNLWSGREEDRAAAVCRFCDTDFVGADGTGGGRFADAAALADAVAAAWPGGGRPFVVLTGGEPLLQLDEALVAAWRIRHAKAYAHAREECRSFWTNTRPRAKCPFNRLNLRRLCLETGDFRGDSMLSGKPVNMCSRFCEVTVLGNILCWSGIVVLGGLLVAPVPGQTQGIPMPSAASSGPQLLYQRGLPIPVQGMPGAFLAKMPNGSTGMMRLQE